MMSTVSTVAARLSDSSAPARRMICAPDVSSRATDAAFDGSYGSVIHPHPLGDSTLYVASAVSDPEVTLYRTWRPSGTS